MRLPTACGLFILSSAEGRKSSAATIIKVHTDIVLGKEVPRSCDFKKMKQFHFLSIRKLQSMRKEGRQFIHRRQGDRRLSQDSEKPPRGLCQTIPLKSLQMPPRCQSRAWLSRSWERAQPGDNFEGSEVKQQKVPDRKSGEAPVPQTAVTSHRLQGT